MLTSRTSEHAMISRRYDSLLLKAGAVCGSSARTDLCGGCQVTGIPTATPAEVETLLGDPSKAKADLGWVPEITLDEMVAEMVSHDLDLAKQHALLKANGYSVDVSKE